MWRHEFWKLTWSFWSSHFSYMTKKSCQRLKYLENEKAFKLKEKTFFIIFKELPIKQITQIFLEGESPTWKRELAKQATYCFGQLLLYVFFSSFYETRLSSYRFICQNWLKNYTSVETFQFFNNIFSQNRLPSCTSVSTFVPKTHNCSKTSCPFNFTVMQMLYSCKNHWT